MRALPNSLATALSTGTRRPIYRVYVWTASSYTEVVTGTNTEAPFDLTPYITEMKWSPEQLGISFTDPEADLHPDYGQYRAKLANGVIVRLKEGDTRVDEAAWVFTFTGKVKGQYGYMYSRSDKTFKGQVTAYFRGAEQSFKRRQITTREYTVGTDMGVTVGDILGMIGITENERRLSPALGRSFCHKTNQIAQLSPWEALSVLLYPAFLVPFFDGEGRFYGYWRHVSKNPDLVLPDYIRVHRLEATAQTGEPTNKVVIKYLDSNLSEIEGVDQKLGSASITTGFFTSREELKCYWSEDRKQRARNTYLKIVKSVNDNLLPVGSESYEETDAYSGKITITISAWVPTLAGALLAMYLGRAAMPDKTESTATNKAPALISVDPVSHTGTIYPGTVVTSEDTGFTIPWGRIEQATILIGILAVMMSLGSAQYEVWGTPFDLVYLEKEQIVMEEGVEYWAENEVEVENDFIGTAEVAEACGINELHYCRSSFNARRLILDDMPGIEPGDVIALPDEGRFFITGLSKSIKPGAVPLLEVSCFKILGLEVES